MTVKFTGKFQDQCEIGDAIVDFEIDWMPHCTPDQWSAAWEDFKEGLLETGWISDWQFKNWNYPAF